MQRETAMLKEQLKLSSDENKLKSTIAALNEQMTKQQTLNRLQASQILEFEQKLWKANKDRDEAENTLADFKSGQSAPTPENEGDSNLNQELRVKQVQLRDVQDKVEMYQGKATVINSFTRQ